MHIERIIAPGCGIPNRKMKVYGGTLKKRTIWGQNAKSLAHT